MLGHLYWGKYAYLDVRDRHLFEQDVYSSKYNTCMYPKINLILKIKTVKFDSLSCYSLEIYETFSPHRMSMVYCHTLMYPLVNLYHDTTLKWVH